MDVLFIGGTGQISLPSVERALTLGHKVWLLNRGTTSANLPAGVETISGDMDAADPYAQLGDRHFDVVCQFRAFTPAQLQKDIDAFSTRTGHYIFISSASVYQKPARHYLITEEVPAENPFWAYSQAKIACENLLKGETGFNWTIVRPSHTMRVGLPSFLDNGDALGHRLLAGKPVVISGDGTSPWTLTRPVDFAVPFVNLFGNSGAFGETFHITQDKGYGWDQIYSAIARGLGVEADIVHVPADTLIRYNPEWTGPLFGDKIWASLFDNSKVKSVAGDFECESDLDKVVADSVMNFKARAAGTTYQPDEGDALMDRIAMEQRTLGG